MASQNTTIICIFLPLSAIWAGLVSGDPAASGMNGHRSLIRDQFYNPAKSETSTGSDGKPFHDKGSVSTYDSCAKSPRESDSTTNHEDFALNRADIDRSDAIYVGRNFTVENDRASEQV
jgi:pheromone alpha factor receptor